MKRLACALLKWYGRIRRPLPWRRSVRPYRIWVAEIMLQQTTIAAVLPRYEKFLRRFPDIKSLAAARPEEVLKAWAGLGYYARARCLHAAARQVMAEHNGELPADEKSMRRLPGVGAYTAAAVLSIAFGRPLAVLDGNVIRVLCRIFAIRADARKSSTQALLRAKAQSLLDRRRPGDWNQAVMELGETICLPENPRCAECPWGRSCAAKAQGLQDRLPVLGPRPKISDLRLSCLWIERDGSILLFKRGPKELILKNLWGLPEERQVKARKGAPIKTVRHAITRYRITLTLRRGRLIGPKPRQTRWVARKRLKDFLVSSLWLKALPAPPFPKSNRTLSN